MPMERYKITLLRVGTTFCMFFAYSMYYVGRKTFPNIMPFLLEDKSLGLQKEHLGATASGFMLFYSVTKFASGVLSDILSPRRVLCLGLLVTGLVNCLFGFSRSAWVFATLWCINGLFQGLGWPPCAKLISSWIPPTQAGTVWSIVTSSGNVSSSLVPIIAIVTATLFGWQATFVICGIACTLTAVPIFLFLYDTPEEAGIPSENHIEKESIKKENGKRLVGALQLLKSPFLQLIGFSYLLVSITKTAFEDWELLYLIQGKGKTKYEASYGTSFFHVGAVVGNLLSGVLSDWCIAKIGKTKKGSPRLLVLIIMCILMLLACCYLHYFVKRDSSSFEVALVSALLGCGSYGPHAVVGLIAVENAPPCLSGTAHAIVAAMAGGGNVIAGLPVAYLFSHYGWDTAFFSLECCCVLGIFVVFLTMGFSADMGKREKTE